MEQIYENIYVVYEYIIRFSVILIELISAGIILFTILKSLIGLFKGKDDIRLEVSEGVLLALEFKLGSEVLRTLIVRDLSELLVLGSIIVLMAALSVFVQWGIKNERKNAEKNKTPTKLFAKGFLLKRSSKKCGESLNKTDADTDKNLNSSQSNH